MVWLALYNLKWLEFENIFCYPLGLFVMLELHYVPGSHGSHGSQKRSSQWCFSHFCLCVQVLLSLATFSQGLSRSAMTEARRRYGLSRMVLRFIPACNVLLGPLTFCYVAIKFCYVYQVLSRFSTINVGDEWFLSPNMPTVLRGGPQSCCNRYIMHPW